MYRNKIINHFKEIWGEDQFLQVATFGTMGPKAVLKRACKGLGIEDDVAEKMSTLVPTDRGVVRPLSICLDRNRPDRIQELIDEVSKYDGMKEILLRLEGLIVSMGSHAGEKLPALKGVNLHMQGVSYEANSENLNSE